MDGTSLTPEQEKLNALRQVLPEAFSEGKIDWEKLKATLGEDINFANERYVLNWAGKSDAFKVLQMPTTKTLIPAKEESVNFDETENIFIEGENLEVLKVLQKSYFGKVKMIYIDPPYNTGNDSFIYPDKFSETKADYERRVGDKDEEGNKTSDSFKKNSKENGQYHSNWLNMMMPRLYLAKNLLRQDGVIYMQIDDNELHNSILLFNEIFGEENYVSTICVKMSHLSGMKMSHKDKKIPKIKEFILVYAKNRDSIKLNTVYTEGEWNTVFDRYTKYVEIIDGIESENWEVHNLNDYIKLKGLTEEKEINSFKISNSKKIFRTAVNDSLKNEPKEDVFRKIITKTGLEKYIYNGEEVLFADKKIIEIDGKNVPAETIGDIWTDIGINNLHKEGEVPFENGKKPLKLIKRVLDISSLENDIIVDFFAGSGTTAHAVMELNKQDRSNRKYLCVQLPELTDEKSEAYKAGYTTIAEISKERIRRAGKAIVNGQLSMLNEKKVQLEKLLSENKLIKDQEKIELLQTEINNLQLTINNFDSGFKVLKLADSNFKQWQQIEGKDAKALAQQMKLFVDPVSESATIENMVYELLLKSGKDLNSPIEKKDSFYKINNNQLILLLEKATQEIIDLVIAEKPIKVVALDKLFKGNDQLKTNAVLQMKDAGIEFKTI
jgi:adenine-specific DNA-methyltransferase